MSSPKKTDRRVKYTKQAIRDSFLKLLSEKPIEKISVTEICREAEINRGTFYSHYTNPYDLSERADRGGEGPNAGARSVDPPHGRADV